MITPTQTPQEALEILTQGLGKDYSIAFHLPTGRFYVYKEGETLQEGSVTHLPSIIFLASHLEFDTAQQVKLENAIKEKTSSLKGRVTPLSTEEKLILRLESVVSMLQHSGGERQARDASLVDQLFFWIEEIQDLRKTDKECFEKGANILKKLQELFPQSKELKEISHILSKNKLSSIKEVLKVSPLLTYSSEVLGQLRRVGKELQERATAIRELPQEVIASKPPAIYVDIYEIPRELLKKVVYLGENLDDPNDFLVSGLVCESYLLAKQAILKLDQWREELRAETHPFLSTILQVSTPYIELVQE
jgi:hypothetical protein